MCLLAIRVAVGADVELTDHPGNASPLSMVCPHRKQISPAVSQLYTWLRSQFSRMEPV
jgi:DNA-binding transcriptional LysR family regulator